MLSTIAEVVIDDSMHKMAVIASNLVTSFLNISLACAVILAILVSLESGTIYRPSQEKAGVNNSPWASLIRLSSMRTVVLAVDVHLVKCIAMDQLEYLVTIMMFSGPAF